MGHDHVLQDPLLLNLGHDQIFQDPLLLDYIFQDPLLPRYIPSETPQMCTFRVIGRWMHF